MKDITPKTTGKRLYGMIRLLDGLAAGAEEDAQRFLPEDPVSLGAGLTQSADGLIVLDQSVTEAGREQSLTVIRKLAQIPGAHLIASGRIRRMEDVKKLLYAGCEGVILAGEDPEQTALIEELTVKFGAEKLYLSLEKDPGALADGAVRAFDGRLLFMTEAARHAAGARDLGRGIALEHAGTLEQIFEIMRDPRVTGLGGDTVNENSKELPEIRRLLRESGIEMGGPAEPLLRFDELVKNADGLVPVVVQEDATDEVLMVAYMNEEAYYETLRTGRMTYWSRSRRELWVKGLTSGHFQDLKSLWVDCDNDTLLARVDQTGAACHTGNHSCFYRLNYERAKSPAKLGPVLEQVHQVIRDRKDHPREGSYTNYLFDKGIDKMLKKLGEEGTEVIIASKNEDRMELVYEISDYLYHLMVVMTEKGVSWSEVADELYRREMQP